VSSSSSDYIGFATIDKDGTLNIELRAASGLVVHRTYFQLKPGEPQYDSYIRHIGQAMEPGHRYGISSLPPDS
jgi:hypothetical protein